MFFSLLKKLFILAVLLLVAWFGFKYYSEKKIKEALDQAFYMASSEARIRYEDVTVHMEGAISLSELEITPRNHADERFYAKNASVVFSNAYEMIRIMYDVKMGNDWELPESLSLRFDGINDALISEYGFYASSVKKTNEIIRQRLSGVADPICGDKYVLGPQAIKEMGYDALFSNVFVEYDFDRMDQKLSVKIGGGVPDSYTATVTVNIENQRSLSVNDLMGMPSLGSVELVYRDEGLTERMNHYCAKKSGISDEEYIARFSTLPDDYYALALGIIPNEAMKAAYVDFLKNPDNITITSYPPSGFNPMALGMYEMQYWVEALGLSLSINDKTVSPFELNMPELSGLHSGQNKVDENDSVFEAPRHDVITNEEIDDKSLPKSESMPSYRQELGRSRVIPLKDVSNYIGHYVKVSVERSKHFTGLLVSVEQDTLSLQLRRGGGTFTMPIEMHRIEAVERLR